MKKIKILLLAAVFMFAAFPVYAEYIFLTDGEIIEGEIISDTDEKLTVREGRRTREIPRNDVLRILYNDDFKQKRYIYTTDDREIPGYIVAEDRRTYTIREDLSSSTETTLQKREVDGIMSRSIRGEKVEDEPRIETKERQRGASIALGLYYKGILDAEFEFDDPDEKIKSDYKQSSLGLVADIAFSGVPLFLRGAFLYEMGEIDLLSFEADKERLGLEFLGTICIVLHRTDNLRLWAGPQISYLYVEKEYDLGGGNKMKYDYTAFMYGGAAGLDFFITDSLYLTAEFGYRLISGNMENEDMGDSDEIDFSGTSPYIGFGVLYQF